MTLARPHPPVISPGATAATAPSDAIVLFDGKDLSKCRRRLGSKSAQRNCFQAPAGVDAVHGGLKQPAHRVAVVRERAQIHLTWRGVSERD